jgi:hypothetical protein
VRSSVSVSLRHPVCVCAPLMQAQSQRLTCELVLGVGSGSSVTEKSVWGVLVVTLSTYGGTISKVGGEQHRAPIC